jgi:predicted aspartyl protease
VHRSWPAIAFAASLGANAGEPVPLGRDAAPPPAIGEARQVAAAGLVTLPTEIASNVFFARVTVNGAGPFWFTIDTGATLTVIDPAAATRAKLTVQSAGRRSNVGVAAGETMVSTTTGATIEVAGFAPFSPSLLYVIDVQANARLLGHQIDGVLGTDFLSRHVIQFDYATQRVTLSTAPSADTTGRTRTVPFTIDGNVLIAPATLTLPDQQRLTARLLIDTGSNGGLTLTSPFVRDHQLPQRFPSRQINLAVGVNGTVTSPVIVLPSIAFGDAAMPSVNAALSQATTGLDASDDFDGLIGAELLRRFTLTIDYPRRLLILSPLRP